MTNTAIFMKHASGLKFLLKNAGMPAVSLCLLLLTFGILNARAHAELKLPENLEFKEDGSIEAPNFSCVATMVSNNWNQWTPNTAWTDRQFQTINGTRITTGKIPIGGGGTGKITITPTGMNRFRYQLQADIAPSIPTQSMHLGCTLPLALRRIAINDAQLDLPENQIKTELFPYRNVMSVSIPLRDGSELTFRGKFRMMVQDSRQFGQQNYELRIAMDRNGSTGAVGLDLIGEIIPHRYLPKAIFRTGLGEKEVRVENDKWTRLDFKRDTVAGSALDFSFLLDAPAGKYGHVVAAKSGHLEFTDRPNVPVRFYGGNMAWDSMFIDHQLADRVTTELVKQGYNWVRAHQHDVIMTRNTDPKDSTEIDPELFERWDYFVFRLKESGIYLTTDIYSSRQFKAGDPKLGKFANNFRVMKALLPFSRDAMDDWKTFARKFLTHVNPYTKMSMAEDPVLACLNLVNEDGLYAIDWGDPMTRGLYTEAFDKYCKERGITGRKMHNTDRVFLKFLHELQTKVHQEQMDFVKNELKVKCPVTSINAEHQVHIALARDIFDLTDLHLYYAGPTDWVDGKVVSPQALRSGLLGDDCIGLVKIWMPARLMNKPVISTEFRYCWPALFREEQGIFMGAYCALQGYDGLCGYGYAEGIDSLRLVREIYNSFDTCNDPLSMFSDRIAELLFLRGDVAKSKNKVAVRIPADLLDRDNMPYEYHNTFRNLGLITSIGSTVEKPVPGIPNLELTECGDPSKLSDPLLRQLWQAGEQNGVYESDTGEIRLVRNSLLQVTTPLSECMSSTATRSNGKIMQALPAGVPATIGLHSLDNQPLENCRSAVLFHLTETSNTGESYEDGTLRKQLDVGKYPLLLRRGKAQITLKTAKPFQIQALNCDGEAVGDIQSQFDGRQQSFTISTDGFPGGVMAYSLKR